MIKIQNKIAGIGKKYVNLFIAFNLIYSIIFIIQIIIIIIIF